jgi:transcriptional regulator with XRE-family HTH domain
VSIASTKQDLLNSLKDREYRAAFNLENVYTTICFQLRALREQREMSQKTFGKQVKPTMAQERISILEDPNADSKPTLNTLLRLADGLDVGLDVRFVPFSTVLGRSTYTNMRELEVDSFEKEFPVLAAQIAFEIKLEDLAPVTIAKDGVTKAGNNLFVFPSSANKAVSAVANKAMMATSGVTVPSSGYARAANAAG